jgi:hypothetical protein
MVELAEKSAEMPAREATSLPQAQRVDRRLSPETIAELVQAYRDGASTSYGDTMNSARAASSSSCTSIVWRCGTKDWSVATLLLQPSYTERRNPGAARRRFSARRMALGDGDQATELAVFGVSVAFELDCQLRQSLRIEVSPLTVVPHGFQRSA